MNRILIAEDEPRIASFLDKGLRANGFSVTVVDDGEDALHMADSDDFDLLILDVGLPAMDGFAVLRELRRRGRRMPIIMLTARDSVEDTVAGLEGGADDYVAKPFRFDELLARVRVRLRTERVAEATVLEVGGASLDLRTRRLAVDGRTEELTAREFALAEMFFRHPGQVLSREQLLSNVWGYDYDPGSNVVEVYIRYLRRKVDVPFALQTVETVRNLGYRLVPDGAVAEGGSPGGA
jgi:two-component system copper resistance phosphate regulon response regulator CusR